MGCDIHPVIEVREHGAPKGKPSQYDWESVACPDRSRNYEFFGLLAGVRGELDAWIAPRGMPDDVSWRTRSPYDSEAGLCDGDHSASWFTLTEARLFVVPDTASEWTKEQWQRWLLTMEFVRKLHDVTPDDVRAVFNFDN